MSKRKLLLFTITIFIVATVCVISLYVGFINGLQACGMNKGIAELMFLNDRIEEQFTNASCEGVKLSINEYLEMLERNKNIEGSMITNTSYYSDKMLSHVRLARIERKLGNIEQEKNHMRLAQESCINRGWKDCSLEHITKAVMRVDEKRPIVCLANEK